MIGKRIRVYGDTSVFGASCDARFAEASDVFFGIVRQGRFELVVSTIVEDELENAPEPVRATWHDMLPLADLQEPSRQALALQEAYLDANILTSKWDQDALHVALATVSNCSAMVSWNFRHIVNFRRIPLYNGVNVSRGYRPIAICSPPEMIEDEE